MNAEQSARARELARQGLSQRDIAAELGVSRAAVRKALAAAPEALAAAAPPAAPAPATDASALEQARALLAETRADLEQARSRGETAAVSRLSRTMAMLMPVVSRLESRERDEADLVVASHAEIERAMRSVRERAAALLDRPLLCAACGRALSISWGQHPEVPHGT